jgi:hypothetical protein
MVEVGQVVPRGECVYAFSPNALVARSPAVDVRPMPYPPSEPIAQQFAACRYIFITARTTRQLGQPPLYPLTEASAWTQPAFRSISTLAGGRVIAAALLRRQDDAR